MTDNNGSRPHREITFMDLLRFVFWTLIGFMLSLLIMHMAFGDPTSGTDSLNINTDTLSGKIMLSFALSLYGFYWTRHLLLRIYRYFVNETDTWADFTAKFFKAVTGLILITAAVAMYDHGVPAPVAALPAVPVIWLTLGRRCVPARHASIISRGLINTLALLIFLCLWFIAPLFLLDMFIEAPQTVKSLYGAVLIFITGAPILWLLRHRIMALYMKMVE